MMPETAPSDLMKHGERRTRAQSRLWDCAAICLLFAVFFAAFGIVPNLGVSWDEHYHLKWGAEKWANYEALLSGEIDFQSFLKLRHSSVHPGFFDLILQGFLRITLLHPNMAGHWLSFAFGLSGLVATWLTGRRLLGVVGGFCALLLLVTTPRYFGHMWFNPKDIPFAACYMWSLYFLVSVIRDFPRPKWSHIVLLGVCTGFALGVRMAGLLIPFYYGFACFVFLVFFSESRAKFATNFGVLLLRGIGAAALAFLAALPFWPALWKSPTGGVSESLGEAQNFAWNGPVLYNGAFENSTQLPWHYLPKWLLITLPEWTLILLVLAALSAFWIVCQQRERLKSRTAIAWLVLAIAALFPIAYVVATRPTLYDGMRHFLFILPPLILVASAGMIGAVQLLARYSEARPWLAYLPVVLSVLFCAKIVAVDYRALGPHYYIYFNGWVGGLSGAYNNYETDYWGLSYREAVEAVEDYVAAQGEVDRTEPWTIAISGAGFLAAPFLANGFELTADRENADFYVAYTRVNQHLKGAGEVVFFVDREGVPLNVVWDQREREDATPLLPLE